MELLTRARSLGRPINLQAIVDAIPYCRFLGIAVDRKGDELTAILRFDQKLIGNPILPALHGGVIGAFLETAAIIQVLWETESETLPKPVDINVEYLRSGRPEDTYARAIITKHGRRVCNVRAEAWQDQREKPIAALHAHFLVRAPDKE